MAIPPIDERAKRACDDDCLPCMFFTAGYECMLPACPIYKIFERIGDKSIIPCKYHITLHEYARMVDLGLIQ